MKRPSFQFYPGDWLANANIRRLNFVGKGVWIDTLCLLHSQEEYGVIRWPLAIIAKAVGCRILELQPLVTHGVIKGDDVMIKEPFVYVPRSGRRDGEPVVLIAPQVGPVWFSSRMVRDEHVATRRGGSGAAPKAPKGESPNTTIGATIGAPFGVHLSPAPPRATRPSSSSSSSREKKEEKDRPVGLQKETGIVTNGHDLPGDAPKRATKRCPSDFFVTEALRSEIAVDCPGIDFGFETKAFRDHEFKTAHSDWAAVWRNWMREAFKRLPPSAKSAPYRGKTL